MEKFKEILKKPWPYWSGGILLACLNVALLGITGACWRITSGFLYWGAFLLEKIGFHPREWYYFTVYEHQLKSGESFFNNDASILNGAVIVGAFMAALLASEFKMKPLKNRKQALLALAGGLVMGYATRISFGCNIGAYFSAIPSFSLHGWVFGIFMFVGAWIGAKLLYQYVL